MTANDSASPPSADLRYAQVDIERSKRQSIPEVVLCPGKTPSQVAAIMEVLLDSEGIGIATKATRRTYEVVRARLPQATYYPTAKVIHVGNTLPAQSASVLVVTAGTSDIPVAEEAAVTASILGHPVTRLFDIGVAGLHRLLSKTEELRKASVIVVVAGMDGALPTVIAGLVDRPVIAVPASTGYGASFKGLAALLAMLNSCVPGVGVVNINNGLGAAALAHRMSRSFHAGQ